jgi:mannonate dehydratase
MKLGFGLHRHQFNDDHYRFARQCGATHLVLHLVDYFRPSRINRPDDQPIGDDSGWGFAGEPNALWTYEELVSLRADVHKHGLQIEAIENFDPAHWHDVLLDGPKKTEQLEKLKTMVRDVGWAGIPMIGYNFSLAGVTGRLKGPWGRGGAQVVAIDGTYDKAIPRRMVEHGLRSERLGGNTGADHARRAVAQTRRFLGRADPGSRGGQRDSRSPPG